MAFWALAEIVRQRLGIAEEDPAEAAAAKLRDGVDQFVPDPAERAYAGVRLGRLLGVPFPGDAGGPLAREELFAGWRLFFERLAGQMPVVLLVEDAQHADHGLLDFLDHLIDWARDLGFLQKPGIETKAAKDVASYVANPPRPYGQGRSGAGRGGQPPARGASAAPQAAPAGALPDGRGPGD